MNNINIATYFDEDFINIIYKDKKINNSLEIEKDLYIEKREKVDNEIHIFNLHSYKLGSIGYTSRELKEKEKNFSTLKYLSNDYNGPNPSYQIAFVKLLFNTESGKILGFQIANEKNIERRLECVKLLMDNNMGIKDLAEAKIYPSDDTNPDILNIAALMAINKKSKLVEVNEIQVEEIENLIKNNEFFLDVREDYEYNAGHIKGAVNIPLHNLVAELNSLPKDRNIYVYCRSGHRSLDAVGFLNSLGLDKIYNVNGGFIELSFNEFRKNKGNLENSILTNYNFE
ncbi:MAG: rhodanese-like domain-containing protein [Fusobacterium gastrosuis]|uniref:rhodanese-like domain-containing protein n=1 Tax=Fusobacterium gastrosuis TaxID=1755100 RepID=UPI002A8ECC10|nr:rhodanese-like domain-containing protein [Fusobacterium gastrosuis]